MEASIVQIEQRYFPVLELPGRPKALLDRFVAQIFEVETKYLNRIVARNQERLPDDFFFELTTNEINLVKDFIAIDSRAWNRSKPKAFTWEGCNMLATLLKSEVAVQRSIHIIRAFTRLERQNANSFEDKVLEVTAEDRGILRAIVNKLDDIHVKLQEVKELKKRLEILEEELEKTSLQPVEKPLSPMVGKNREDEIISASEAQQLKDMVSRRANSRKQKMKTWAAFKRHFRLAKYCHLPQKRMPAAIAWIENYYLKK